MEVQSDGDRYSPKGSLNAQGPAGFGGAIVAEFDDGVTNVHTVLSEAAANGRNVHAFTDVAGSIVSAQLA